MARGNQGSQFYLLQFYDIQNTDTPTQAVNKCCTIFSTAPTCSRIPGTHRLYTRGWYSLREIIA